MRRQVARLEEKEEEKDAWMPSPGLVTLRYFAVTENPI